MEGETSICCSARIDLGRVGFLSKENPLYPLAFPTGCPSNLEESRVFDTPGWGQTVEWSPDGSRILLY